MAKLLLGIVLGASLAWAGHIYGVLPATDFASSFRYTVVPPMRDQLGCKAIASTHLYALRPIGNSEPTGTVKIEAGRGTDTLAVKIDAPKNRLMIITGADVRTGFRTDSEGMAIIRNDDGAIVAVRTTPGDAEVYIFRLDKETGNAVWGKVGELLMGSAVAWTHYMECR